MVLLAAILLACAIFLPIWMIQLTAPQYPEGLILKIYAKGLAGDVDVINGLNHYIGMRTLHSNDFIEFTLLPYILGTLVILGIVAVIMNKKKGYYLYIGLFMLVAVISMVDFYRWEYNYGHNLDPEAPIQVPGMSYQPPLIGFKQLLNFGAYSIPHIGGWLFVGAGVLLLGACLLILRPKRVSGTHAAAVLIALLLAMPSCSTGPAPIKYGSDACHFCKMTIMQKQFATEWVTEKGKVYHFDDLHCLLSARRSKGVAYINDFKGKKELVKADQVFFVKSDEVNAPMGGHIIGFADKKDADSFLASAKGIPLSWEQVQSDIHK
jgi:copper chaperone NosL